jgi:hypothetical protein
VSRTGTTTERVRAALRQRRFPRWMRITAVDLPDRVDDLVEALRRAGERPDRSDGPERPAEAADGTSFDDRTLADLVTALWRTRRRMVVPGTDEPRPDQRQAFRHVQSTWDVLAGAEVTIQDHDGGRFESGLALDVLAFQPTRGLAAEQVVETVRPSVYVRGRAIQRGQVIVGTPQDGPESENESEGSEP